jgi:hypothetical protein
MGQEEKPQDPQELRELARRVRVIASAMDDTERDRLLAYAVELDALAGKLEGPAQ